MIARYSNRSFAGSAAKHFSMSFGLVDLPVCRTTARRHGFMNKKHPVIPGESEKDRKRRLMKEWQKQNADRLRAYYTNWGRQHRQSKRASIKRWYEKNKKKRNAQIKEYKERNSVKVKANQAKYDARPDRISKRAISTKRWQENNPEKYKLVCKVNSMGEGP